MCPYGYKPMKNQEKSIHIIWARKLNTFVL